MLWIYYSKEYKVIWLWKKFNNWFTINSWKRVTWKISEKSLEDILQREIEQWFTNKDIWDPNREYWFTHLLRQHAEFRLTKWARNILFNWTRYNIIAASRGQWKTFLASFVAVRWLLDPRRWFWWRNFKYIKIFVPDKELIWNQILDYMKSLIWSMADFKLKNWKKAFEFSWFNIKCNITWNKLSIVSLYNFWNKKELWNSLWEWLACDLAIIDEAARISTDFWTSFHQRAAMETQEFFILSTINEETPVDHWFYRLIIDWEVWDKTITSYRITIDNNEIMRHWKTNEVRMSELEKVKKELREKSEKELYSKWYCIILEESNVFQLTWNVINSNISKYKDDDIRLLWFDLWKLDDTAWITLINLTHREIESSIKVSNATYWMQLDYARDYKNKYRNLIVVWDRSWVWEAVSEQDTDSIVDIWIKSTWVWELSFNKKYRYYTCNKWMIITTMATIISEWLVKIPNHNWDLIEQMTNFTKMKSWRWEVILYKWKWKHKDDLVLSTAYVLLYMYSILWLKKIKDIEEYVKNIWNENVYLYNDTEENNKSNYYWTLY
jgi:hypothetical protein